MKRIVFTLLCCICIASVKAQIISPDTVCVGVPVTFTSACDTAITYAWAFNSVNIDQPLSQATIIGSGSNFAVSACITMNYDNGNYYSFNTNHGSQLVKLYYGTSPYNVPVITDMGSLGGALNSDVTEDIDVIKDSSTSTWYGFIADGAHLVALNFGNSLANTPTTNIINLASANVAYGMQISIMRYNGQWIGFLGNYTTDYIVRLDFGSSLTNTPTATDLPNYGYLHGPCYFALMQQSGNWYMMVSNLNNNYNLVRYDFGTDLQNNNPTATDLGNPAGLLFNPRGITFIQACDSFYGYVINEGAHFFKMEFQNDITNAPTLTNLGSLGTNAGIATLFPFWYNDSLFFYSASFNNVIYRVTSYGLPSGGTYSYTSPQTTYTFTAPGTYPITLFCNQGDDKPRNTFCKDIVVTTGTATTTTHDTSMCSGNPITLQPTITGSNYTWNTGAVTQNITVTQSGTYWITTLNGSCTINVDTFHVQFIAGPIVSLGNDTSICQGSTLVLFAPQFAGNTYLWSTGSTQDSIHALQSGAYWLAVTSSCGTTTDTIHVQVNPIPVVNLGNDTTLCAGLPLTLHSSGIYTGATYLWSNGNATSAIQPIQTGSYWLDVTQNGCTGKDTVNVTFKPLPAVNLGSDISSCQGDSAILISTQPAGSAYLWSTGSTQDSVHALQSGAYWLTVTGNNGCKGSDTINVQFNPSLIVNLGDDTTLCSGHLLTLQSSFTYTGATYLWSAGNTSPSIQVSQQGAYWLTVTKNGCSGSDTVHVAVVQSPQVQLGNDTAICQGNAITLTSTQPSGYVYTWSTGSANTSIPVTQSGMYWLSVNNNGCIASDTIHVTVNPIPDVNLGDDTGICAGKSLTLASLNTFSNATYAWSTGATNSAIQVSQAGSYWLTINENGCKGSDTVQVSVNPVPTVALGNDTTICVGATIMLSPIVQPVTNPIYTWSTGNTSSSIAVSQAGVYWVSVTENGCAASDSIRIKQIEKPFINLGNDTTLCPGVLFTLSAGNNAGNTITWSNSTNNSTFSVTGTGVYYATVTNACGTASDTISVTYQYCDIWFPSAFTPNNDGKNDNIKAVGGLAEISGYKLAIYNRWGQLVFSTYDKYDGWNGTFKGVAQPIGTYDYMITYSYNGSSYKMKGDFELLR